MRTLLSTRVSRLISIGISVVLALGPGFEGMAAMASPVPAPPSRTRAVAASSARTASKDASPTVVRELTDKRTETSTQWLLSDGTVRADFASAPIRFKDAHGTWKDIDRTVVQADSPGRMKANSMPFDVNFHSKGSGTPPVSLSESGYSIGIDVLGADENTKTARGARLHYSDVAAQADLDYDVLSSGVEQTVVLKDATASPTWRVHLTLQGVSLRRDAQGEWAFFRPNETVPVYSLGSLIVHDSSVNDAGEPAYCADATMSVTVDSAGNADLTYSVPPAWLTSPERVFPVRVDPTITRNTNGDTYVSSQYPTAKYDTSSELKCGYYDPTTGHNRAYVKFDLGTTASPAIPAGSYISDTNFAIHQTHQYYEVDATNVHLGRLLNNFSPGTTWISQSSVVGNPAAKTDMDRTKSIAGRAVWVNFDVDDIAKTWIDDLTTNKGFMLYQFETSAEDTTHWRKFDSGETANVPQLSITYTNPGITGTAVDKTSYRVGDVVKAVVRINTTLPQDINCVKAYVNGTDSTGARVRRGTFQWTETEPSNSEPGEWPYSACPGTGGGFVSYRPASQGSSNVELIPSQCNEFFSTDYAEFTLAWRLLNGSDTTDNDITVTLGMNPTDGNNAGNRWTKEFAPVETNFNVTYSPSATTAATVDRTTYGYGVNPVYSKVRVNASEVNDLNCVQLSVTGTDSSGNRVARGAFQWTKTAPSTGGGLGATGALGGFVKCTNSAGGAVTLVSCSSVTGSGYVDLTFCWNLTSAYGKVTDNDISTLAMMDQTDKNEVGNVYTSASTTSNTDFSVTVPFTPTVSTEVLPMAKTNYHTGDYITGIVRVYTPTPENINCVRITADGTDVATGARVRRGSLQWTKNQSSNWAGSTVVLGDRPGFSSYDPGSCQQVWPVSVSTQNGNGYVDFTFVWQALEGYGNVEDTDITTVVMMDPAAQNDVGNMYVSPDSTTQTNYAVRSYGASFATYLSSSYRTGDIMAARIEVDSASPQELNCVEVIPKGTLSGATPTPVSRGRFQWTRTRPSSGWSNPIAATGIGGWVSYDASAQGAAAVELVGCDVQQDAGYLTLELRLRLLNGYRDVDNNQLFMRALMGPSAGNDLNNEWDSGYVTTNSYFSVDDLSYLNAINDLSYSTSASSWFLQSAPGSANDSADQGRGAVTLSWSPVAQASGYQVMMFDGNREREVGRTFGNTSTSFSTAGLGLYPTDTTLKRLGTLSGSLSPVGSSPLATASFETDFDTLYPSTGIVVSDGSDLFMHQYADVAGATSWQRVASGTSGSTAGSWLSQVGLSTGRSFRSAAMIDQVIYEGFATTAKTLEGISKDEAATSSARKTFVLDKALLSRHDLSEITGASSDVVIAYDPNVRKFYSVSAKLNSSPATFKVRAYDVAANGTSAKFTADRDVIVPSVSGVSELAGAFAAAGQLYLIERGGSSRILRLSTSSWTANGLWTIDGAGAYNIVSGAFDPASRSVFTGSTGRRIRRYLGPGFDLRDNPAGLYAAAGPDTTQDSMTAYSFRVIPFGSVASPDAANNKVVLATLDNRTYTGSQDIQHADYDLGEVALTDAQAYLEPNSKSLELEASDLEINSWGPEASLTRSYNSRRTSTTYLTPGWRFNFEQSITASGPAMVFTDEAGDEHVFTLLSGVWTPPPGLVADLVKNADSSWSLTFKDRSCRRFDAAGKLVSETDANGNTTRYNIGASAVMITAANGQSIEVTLSAGRATGARLVAAAGAERKVTYSAAAALDVIKFPDVPAERITTTFVYSGNRVSSASIADLTFSGCQAIWNFTYSADGGLVSVTKPAATSGSARPITTMSWDVDSGLARASVTYPAVVRGSSTSVTERFWINPTGTIAKQSDPAAPGDTETFNTFTYTGAGDVAKEISPSGNITSGTYDARGNLLTETDALGHVTRHEYVADLDVRDIDPRGGITTSGYDAQGNLIWTERDLNANERARTEYSYDGYGRAIEQRTQIDDKCWRITSYSQFASSGEPQRTVTSAALRNADGSLTPQSLNLGNNSVSSLVTATSIDPFGQVRSKTKASGVVEEQNDYSSAGNLISSTNAAGVTTVNTYDPAGNVIESYETTNSARQNWKRSSFDAYGRAVREANIKEDGTEESYTTHTFDDRGNEISSTDSLAGTSLTWYDAQGRTVAEWEAGASTGSLANATRTSYDADGNEIRSIEPGSADANATVTDYDAAGREIKVTEPDGSWVTYIYDAAGNQISMTSPTASGGRETEYTTYDLANRAESLISPAGLLTQTIYDRADNPVSTVTTSRKIQGSVAVWDTANASRTNTSYNELGWELQRTDADGTVTRQSYDLDGEVLEQSVWAKDATSPNVTTLTVYDGAGNILRQTVTGATTTAVGASAFSGVSAAATDPGAEDETVYSYDQFGNPATETHSTDGEVTREIETTYDEFARPVLRTDSASEATEHFSYGQSGGKSLARVEYASMEVTATSDASGRELSQRCLAQTAEGGKSLSRTVKWDTVRNLPIAFGSAVGSGVTTTTLSYDALGRLVGIGAGAWKSGGVKAVYDTKKGSGAKVSDATSIPWGRGRVTIDRSFTYTSDSRLAKVSTTDGDYSYAWNASGEIEKATDARGVTDFTNESGHVAKAANGSKTTTYTYDALGRRVQETSVDSVKTLSWGDDGTLLSWERRDAGAIKRAADFDYDSSGQRYEAHVFAPSPWNPNAVNTDYTYGWSGLNLRYVNAESKTGMATVSYIYGADGRPWAGVYERANVTGTSVVKLFHLLVNDHGDVVALADEQGEIFARYAYGPFGEMERTSSRKTNRITVSLANEIARAQVLRYAGYCYDSWSGQYYLQARYYDPMTKQFISKDPARADGEESAYQYCGGDPVGRVDPAGLHNSKIGFHRHLLGNRHDLWWSTRHWVRLLWQSNWSKRRHGRRHRLRQYLVYRYFGAHTTVFNIAGWGSSASDLKDVIKGARLRIIIGWVVGQAISRIYPVRKDRSGFSYVKIYYRSDRWQFRR